MACGCGQVDSCYCGGRATTYQAWRPTLTAERACQLVHTLLNSQGCSVECPDWELCRLLKLQCELCGGKYPIATLAMLTAAQILQTEALSFARRGNVQTLTIKYNGNQSADVLLKIAEQWRESAIACHKPASFGIVATGKGCLSHHQAFKKCGCDDYRPSKLDSWVTTNCAWDCCEDCEDEGGE